MVIIRFHDWEEFLEELAAKPPADRVVRLTFSRRYDGHEVPHLTLGLLPNCQERCFKNDIMVVLAAI